MAPQQTENKVGQKTVEYYIYNQKGIRGNDNTGVKMHLMQLHIVIQVSLI